MQVGVIEGVRRYPVKSMGGEALDAVELGSGGLPGDRAWAVRDEVKGGIRGAKKIPALMNLQARYATEPAATGSSPAEITLPGGEVMATGDAAINDRLTKALGKAVTLWPLLPADALDHYRRGAPDDPDFERELRAMFGRTSDEPLPDLGAFPPEIMQYESPPGIYFDAFPLLMMSSASMATLAARAPESSFDVRRFRPNFVIGETDPSLEFPESSWVGKKVRLGEAILSIEMDCPRCVMTTHGFEDLPKDPKIMRTLVREANGNLGVYAKVEEPGCVRVGDAVEVVA